MNHTKGPWKIEFGQASEFQLFGQLKGENETRIAHINYFDGGCGGGEDFANAALIATAPDLLAACEQFVINFESDDKTGSVFDDVKTLKMIKQAIKKAKGEL